MRSPGAIARADWAARLSLFTYACTHMVLPTALVQIQADLNLSNTQAGSFAMIGSIQSIGMLLLSGILAVKFGKLRLLQVAAVIIALSMLALGQSIGFGTMLAAVLLFGLGAGLIEALVTPLVEDLHPKDTGHKQNLLHAFWPIGVLTSTTAVAFGLGHGMGWRTVYLILAGLVLATVVVYPNPKRLNLPRSRADFSHAREILKRPHFWVLSVALFFAGGAEGGFTFWTAKYIQTHFETGPEAGGQGLALFALGMALGRLTASRLANRFSLRQVLLVNAALTLVLSLLFPLLPSLWMCLAMVGLIGFTIACFWPSLQTHAARRIDCDPTMLMIFLSCCGIPGFSSGVFAMGIIADTTSMTAAFVVVPIFLVGLMLAMLVEAKQK